MSRFPIRLLVFGCMMWLAAGAFAAETGTLRGTVRDASNQAPLENVTVTLEGGALPGGRTRMTDTRGNFWIPVLPPGEYRITFNKDGFQTKAFDATVRLDQTTTLPPIELSLLTFTSETIEIVESSPVIDNTQSAVVENIGEDYFSRVPVGRSYQSVIRTLPGVSGRIDYESGGPSDGNPSVRGEGRYGNNYLLEGFSIRDPVSKTTGMDLPFDALQEISVYTDGAPAEFGNFTGMVANILLKSGSNETHGTLEYILDSHLSFGQYEIMGDMVDKRTRFFQTPTITLGGPIVQDKIWYFGVLQYSTGQQQLEGAPIAGKTDYAYQFLSRFTYSPFTDSSTLLNLTVQSQGGKRDNVGADASTELEATVNALDELLSINGNMKTVLSPFVVLEVKANRFVTRYNSEPTVDPFIPSYTDIGSGHVSGNVPYTYSSMRERQGFAFHLTRYVTEALGQHVVKGGYEFHKSNNLDEFTFTGGAGTPESPAYQYNFADFTEDLNNNGQLDEGEDIDGDGQLDLGDGLYQPGEEYSQTASYNVGPLGHVGTNNVFFLQDQWQPIGSLTLNLGVRVDTEALVQNSGREILSQAVISPRFGFAWDVTQDSTNLITANAGRYYDINGLSFADWGDTRSAFYFQQCYWDPSTQTYSDSCYTQDPVGNPLTYSEDLRPYHMDKLTLGYDRAFTAFIKVGLKGILSTTRDLPEDAQFTAGSWAIINPAAKKRDFWGVELTVERQFSDNWQVLSSLTYSRSKGTSAGSFESGSSESTGGDGNGVGVFMDDIADPYLRTANDYFGYDFAGLGYDSYTRFGQTYEGSTEGYYGYLPYHSFVNAKVNGSYRFGFGTDVGLVYEFDSGHAWQRRGYQDLYGSHSTFPEGRGARFMPPVHYLDLRIAHEFSLPKNVKLAAEVIVFNVLDLQEAVTYYENWTDPLSDERDADGNLHYYAEDVYGNLTEVNSDFGKTLYRQAPRSIRGSLKFSF